MNTLKDFYNEWKENNYKIKPEIQIAMTVLGRIRTEKNKPYWVDLPPINLFKVKLANANLLGANLQGADLWGAQNYTIEQLLEARTLYDIKGLSNEDKEAIRAKKRQLLDDPSVFEVKVHK
ncbi:MAG: pentapeptide repeat-containing protein [bacterium]|nr:pentapeptide repeat-containing protein [bacterium]